MNSRDIRVARNNGKVSDLQVKLQVETSVAAVLNLYWDLVSFNDAVRIKQKALATAQELYEGNKKQTEIGAMAGIEVTRAAAGVSSSKEDLLIAETNVQQQEIVLKNALSRNVTENAWLDDIHIRAAGSYRGAQDRGSPAGTGPDPGGARQPHRDFPEQAQSGKPEDYGEGHAERPDAQSLGLLPNVNNSRAWPGPLSIRLYNGRCGSTGAFSWAARTRC